ncbi:NAD(P)-binding domain-containing protein [Kibdelosporangium aridum]|uniref:Uncharacterized protein n=1 Tax=Kibdelosporangium aridum TaxID=2030 RepID=A0A1W2FWL0_KIBAR|nr:NAD(P)-binding domain-containing protein [Kibdelosporangium aridum]SMD26026.1 hypothetical protein SAMN05661093_09604 [Kibdelosporangium aridum]
MEKLRELHYDRVIACTGFRFDASVFDDGCRPALVIKDRFPEQNVPGLYFAGTLTQQRDFKKSTSGFIHGFRYGVRALYRILTTRYHGESWPAATVEPTQDAISDAIIARVNVSSALWQQFSVLGDVVTVDGDTALYQDEVPIAYVADGGFGPARHRFVVNLEYGAGHDSVDPFDISVSRPAENDAANAHDSAYLHPVVRYYRDGQLAVFVKECLA